MKRIAFLVYNYEQGLVFNPDANKTMFYKNIVSLLQTAGNEVLCIDCVGAAKKKIPQRIINKLEDFNPDICIIGNYGFWDLSEVVNCPLWYLDIDSIDKVSFSTIYRIRNNINRCSFIITESKDIDKIKNKFNATNEQIVLIDIPYTNLASTKEKDIDILYFGNNYCSDGYSFLNTFLQSSFSHREFDEAMTVLKQYQAAPLLSSKELYNENQFYSFNRLEFQKKTAFAQIVGVQRLKILSAISSLGLQIYGTGWDKSCMNYYPELLLCARNAKNYSFLDNDYRLYNRAKITIVFDDNPYAPGSYLRLIDALSSDTCVIAQGGGEHEELFKKYGLPTFYDMADAVALCSALIKDDSRRAHITEYAHTVLKINNDPESVLNEIDNHFGGVVDNNADGALLEVKENKLSLQVKVVKPVTKPTIIEKPQQKQITKERQNSIRKIIKAILLRFGYDIDNRYSKICYMLGPIIIYENLKIDGNTNQIFIFSLPILALKKKNGRIRVTPLFFEKMVKLFTKPISFVCKKIKHKHVEKKAERDKLMAANSKLITYKKVQNELATGKKIRICLFVSRISCWIFGDLYSTLIQSGKFDPIVVVKPFMFNGHDAMVDYMNNTYESLKNRGYNVVKGYDETTGEFLDVRNVINPDIVFYTKYWLPQFQENFYINKFEDKLTFYTSYCFDIAYHPECMNFELNNKVDRYFMPTPIHKKMAEVAMTNHAKNVYVVGAPKLDVFFDKTYKPKDVWKPQEKRKKRIIWAPHHSDNFPGNLYQFNAFYELTDFMFEMAEKYKEDIQIAFKPHPMLKPYLVNKKWGKESADAYYEKWANLDNGQLETGEFIDLFLTSDAMILDSISFIAEYTATNKPSLFTIGSTSRVKLNDFGAINFEVLYHTDNNLKADIERFIVDVVINGNDTKKDERTKFVNKYLLPPNGKSAAENIYDNIIDEIYNGDKRKK